MDKITILKLAEKYKNQYIKRYNLENWYGKVILKKFNKEEDEMSDFAYIHTTNYGNRFKLYLRNDVRWTNQLLKKTIHHEIFHLILHPISRLLYEFVDENTYSYYLKLNEEVVKTVSGI